MVIDDKVKRVKSAAEPNMFEEQYLADRRSRIIKYTAGTIAAVASAAIIGYTTLVMPFKTTSFTETLQGWNWSKGDSNYSLVFDPHPRSDRPRDSCRYRVIVDRLNDSKGNHLRIGNDYKVDAYKTLTGMLSPVWDAKSIQPTAKQ